MMQFTRCGVSPTALNAFTEQFSMCIYCNIFYNEKINHYTASNTPSGYYVYAYLRSKDSTTAKKWSPYYIGKGKGRRAIDKEHSVAVPKNLTRIVILYQDLDEKTAYDIEETLVTCFGLKDDGTGILENRTYGGMGGSGGTTWFNNGKKELQSRRIPKGIGWKIGRLPLVNLHNKGKKRWTNGEINKLSDACPGNGFYLGSAQKSTKCWWNNGIEEIQSDGPIGPDFKKGRLFKGYYWNNGIQCIKSIDFPGEGWIKGKLPNTSTPKGHPWWNNGVISVRRKICPDGFTSGRLHLTGTKWWTDGITEIQSVVCPFEGWYNGRVYSKSNKKT